MCAHVHTSQGKFLIGNYSQWYLVLLIPGSILNTRNAPGARPYCNRQPLTKKLQIERNCKNLTPQKFLKLEEWGRPGNKGHCSVITSMFVYLCGVWNWLCKCIEWIHFAIRIHRNFIILSSISSMHCFVLCIAVEIISRSTPTTRI